MSTEYYIASVLSKRKKSSVNKGVTRIISVSLWSVAISLVAMILSICIVKGFQREVQNKVIQFDAHIRLGKYNFTDGLVNNPIRKDDQLIHNLYAEKEVSEVHVYAEKGGIIKTEEEVHGILIKGIGPDYRKHFFEKNLKEGRAIQFKDSTSSNDVVISKKLADLLKLKLNDKLRIYFIQDPIRVRAFTISGIYKSGLEQFDGTYIFADVKHIQKLNGWSADQYEGYEIFLHEYDQLFQMDELILKHVGYEMNALKITDRYIEIFGWLDLLDMNVLIILAFAILVSVINMLSTLLIMVLEKTNLIGTLKVMGANNKFIVRVFSYLSLRIILRGMIFGNLVALILAFLQYQFSFLTLPEESYYVDRVPIYFDWLSILMVNALTLMACFFSIWVPSFVISRIKPSSAVKFA